MTNHETSSPAATRELGYYWVRHRKGEWAICEWVNWSGMLQFVEIGQEHTTFSDANLMYIDERRLVPPSETPTTGPNGERASTTDFLAALYRERDEWEARARAAEAKLSELLKQLDDAKRQPSTTYEGSYAGTCPNHRLGARRGGS